MKTCSLTRYIRVPTAVLLLTLMTWARGDEISAYGFGAAVKEITQLLWLAETARACGWARDTEATKFEEFSIRFLTAHLSRPYKLALVSLITETRYKAELRKVAREAAHQNCNSSRWQLGWLSYKAAADEHDSEY